MNKKEKILVFMWVVLLCIVGVVCCWLLVINSSQIIPLENTYVAQAFLETSVEKIIIENEYDTLMDEVVVITPPKSQVVNSDFNVSLPCGFSYNELVVALDTDNHKEFIPYVDTFIKAENDYGVNALFLLCLMGLESGWGKYTSGDNNIAGWTNNHGGYKDFCSVNECILYVAKKISTTYKDAVGTRLENVCYRYCHDDDYLIKIIDIMSEREAVVLNAVEYKKIGGKYK